MDKSLQKFGQEMAHLMPKFMKEVLTRQSKVLSAGNITIPQMIVLTILREEDRLKMSDIARNMSITTSAATGIVHRMVKLHLLERIADEKDRRIINIEMTEKARHIIDDIQKRRYKMMMEMFGKLTQLERNRYLETLKKIYHTLAEGHRKK